MTDVPVRVVLDANILFSRVLHELMGRAGTAGLFAVVWSEELLHETRRVLVERRGLAVEIAEQWVDLVRQNFPDGECDIGDLQPDIDLSRYTPDPDDQHVCALAIVAGAGMLVSADRDFRSERLATEHGVTVRTPDAHLVGLLDDGNNDMMVELLETWAGSRDDTTVDQLLDKIENAGCGRFAARVRAVTSGR